ncbi:hypothetical protein [Phormidium sp. CCY1219]|jgi:hypothetical protein|uniref:hypothetical protein n=1 Tax=Phormidium sp. CCY1219 TaxID=2886104 RepID=UPI002D1F233B|nr:hypothetical protein [Phormidium sp. CCY1219]MEB3830781.1 hypothetical protein [Phormidium sp. CCY1219]
MTLFRQYIAPFLIVLVFLVALLAVSARIFLPSDMMAPAPISEPVLPQDEQAAVPTPDTVADLPPSLSALASRREAPRSTRAW